MSLSDILPARGRYALYVLLVVVGVALGAIQAWCTAASIAPPDWHGPALAVLGYLSAAVGLVAAANVSLPEWHQEPGSDDFRGERTPALPTVVVNALLQARENVGDADEERDIIDRFLTSHGA